MKTTLFKSLVFLLLLHSIQTTALGQFPCIATTDTTRCLIVFTKFKDDSFGQDLSQAGAECLQDSVNSWPWNINVLPPFTKKIIDSAATTHPTPGSLTDYFYQMSGGNFFLIGDIYPELIIPIFEQKYYNKSNRRGLAWFNQKILEAIDSKVDFQRYDTNPCDSQADMILLLFRLLKSTRFEGEHFQGKAFLGGFKPVVLDGIRIEGKVFGSGFTSDCYKNTGIKLLAHEIGHYLFGAGHRSGIGTFGLMGEKGYSSMCAREREFLGWSSPKLISQTTSNDTLKDLTTTGDCQKIFLNSTEYLLLENRQRLSVFEQLIDEPCKQGELQATGLVVSHVWGNQPAQFTILPADGKLIGKGDSTDTFQPGGSIKFDSAIHPSLKLKSPAVVQVKIENLRQEQNHLIYDIRIEEIPKNWK